MVRCGSSNRWIGVTPVKMNFSPDGRSIVYDFRPKEESPQRDIFVLASDGSREIPLVKHPADDYLLGWSPEGRWILFASDRRGSWDAWAIEVADGKPQGAPALVKLGIGEINPQRRLLLPPLERGHLGSLHRHDRPDNRQRCWRNRQSFASGWPRITHLTGRPMANTWPTSRGGASGGGVLRPSLSAPSTQGKSGSSHFGSTMGVGTAAGPRMGAPLWSLQPIGRIARVFTKSTLKQAR